MNYMQYNNNKYQNYQRYGAQQGRQQNVNDCCAAAVTQVSSGCVQEQEDCMEDLYRNDKLRGCPIAMAYVPWQRYKELYNDEQALVEGTVFKQLRLEFYARRCD